MLAVLLALGASATWGLADFFGPLKGRRLGALRVLVYAQLAGLTAIAVVVAVRGKGPAHPAAFLAIPAAVSGTLGLYSYYRGMAVGAMSVVAPIAGASAAVPVVFGVATGDRPSIMTGVGIAAALTGVVLASRERHAGGSRVAAGRRSRRGRFPGPACIVAKNPRGCPPPNFGPYPCTACRAPTRVRPLVTAPTIFSATRVG